MEAQVNLLRTLGDPTRLKLLKLILKEELCICELVELLQVSQPAVSQHVARLRHLGLLSERRSGMWTYYKADPERLERALAGLAAFLRADLADVPSLAEVYERRLSLDRAQCSLPPAAANKSSPSGGLSS